MLGRNNGLCTRLSSVPDDHVCVPRVSLYLFRLSANTLIELRCMVGCIVRDAHVVLGRTCVVALDMSLSGRRATAHGETGQHSGGGYAGGPRVELEGDDDDVGASCLLGVVDGWMGLGMDGCCEWMSLIATGF